MGGLWRVGLVFLTLCITLAVTAREGPGIFNLTDDTSNDGDVIVEDYEAPAADGIEARGQCRVEVSDAFSFDRLRVLPFRSLLASHAKAGVSLLALLHEHRK